MKELGVYTRYSELGASSRLRCYRYADMLWKCGFDVRMHPLFGDDTLQALYSGRGRGGKLARDIARRMLRLPCAEEKLWIEYELLPGVPYGVERLYLRDRSYVLSFDDAVYLKYRGRPLLDGKFERLAAGAAGVMAANDLLVEHFSRFNANTVKIPTAVDTDALAPGAEKFPRFTVAWIGTPVTFAAHFSPFVPMFRKLALDLDVDFAVIGGGEVAERVFPEARRFAWSEAVEREVLPRCHAGVMPLPANDDFAAGKSAYKLLQYFAAGLPAVASPVGENRVVVEAGVTGFPAESEGEWREALRRLVSDAETRGGMAVAARAEAVEKYSVRRIAPDIEKFLEKTFFGA